MATRRQFHSAIAALGLTGLTSNVSAQDLSLHGGEATSSRYFCTFGPLVGAAADYRMGLVRIGAYVEFVGLDSCSSDHGFERFEAVRFGPQLELHPVLAGVVDPWVGATFGAFHRSEGFGADVSGSFGLDFRVNRKVSIGGLFVVIVPLGNDRDEEGKSVGMITSSIMQFPVPTMRIVINLDGTLPVTNPTARRNRSGL